MKKLLAIFAILLLIGGLTSTILIRPSANQENIKHETGNEKKQE